MTKYPFPHDSRVYLVADDRLEVAYYSRDKRKFKRVRDFATQAWSDAIEQEIDHDHFWMVVACIERKKRHA